MDAFMVNARPKLNDATVQWKLPSADKVAFQEAAEHKDGMSLSAWLLEAGREKLERERK